MHPVTNAQLLREITTAREADLAGAARRSPRRPSAMRFRRSVRLGALRLPV